MNYLIKSCIYSYVIAGYGSRLHDMLRPVCAVCGGQVVATADTASLGTLRHAMPRHGYTDK